ncbi:MAG: histidine kinase [Betaproteobacteria bacterium]|nr:histidine kinase [Betaproteobacteria bacterium]
MSIKQNFTADALPDFRNLGVVARILLGVNALAFAAVLVAVPGWDAALERILLVAARLEPALAMTLAVLFALSPALGRLRYWHGVAAVVALALAVSGMLHAASAAVGDAATGLPRTLALAAGAALLVLAYLRLLTRAYSPALAEARLQALQSRIRPHFLFNSLNAVLSLIRRDPRRAEQALEDLADLFRVLMQDNRRFVPLADEIALLERYVNLEQLRLGARLVVAWELETAPRDAMMPPMVLQPLLENAIYHGIEPGTGEGRIVVHIARRGARVLARIDNPYIEEQANRAGNRMALENIRERLQLFFDAEARVETRVAGARYVVEIEMPYRAAHA